MKLKPLEPGDSVQVKYTVQIHGNDSVVYIDGKLCESNTGNCDWWLVEYQLQPEFNAPKFQNWWHEDDITSKHYLSTSDEEYFEKAEKIDFSSYDGVLFWDDYFFDSRDELLKHWENIAREGDTPPKYAWACETSPVKLNLNLSDYVTESLEDNGYEGLSEDSCFSSLYDELNSVQDKFTRIAATKIVSFPNYKKAVLL